MNFPLHTMSCKPTPVQSCCASGELVVNSRGWTLPSTYNCPLHQDTQEHDLVTCNSTLRYLVLRSSTLRGASCNPTPVQSCCASAELLVNSRGWPLPSAYNCPLHQDTQEHDLETHNSVLTCLHDVVGTLEIASCKPIPVQSCCASAELVVNGRSRPLPSSYNCPLHQDTQEHDLVIHSLVLRCPHEVAFRSYALQATIYNPIPVQSCCASAELLVDDRGWPLPSKYNCPLHQDTQEHDIITLNVVLKKAIQ